MKPKIFVLCMLAFLMASCNLPSSATPAQFETPVIVATNTVSTGGVVTLDNVSFTAAFGSGKGAQSEMVSAVTDTNNSPWWEIAPAHLEFTLTGYQVQDKAIEPKIFVYPADEYAKLNSNAADQIQKLKSILAGAPLYQGCAAKLGDECRSNHGSQGAGCPVSKRTRRPLPDPVRSISGTGQ